MRPLHTMTAAALAALVLVSAALGGSTYLWCVPMARTQSHCCCHVPRDQQDVPRVSGACCETHELGTLPASTQSTAAPISLPAVVAVVVPLPRPTDVCDVVDAVVAHALPEARAGPSERRHASVSVFLI